MEVRLILSLVCLVTFISGYTQKESELNNSLNISFSPLPFIDFYSGSSYRFASEVRLFNEVKFQLEYGGYLKSFNGVEDVKGYTLRPELRFYLNEDAVYGSYISVEYFFKNQSYWSVDSINIYQQDNYRKEYQVSKIIQAFSVNIGGILKSGRWFVNYYGGLGVRFKNVNCTLTDEEYNNIDYGEYDAIAYKITNECGNSIKLNIIAGFRLGFILS